MNLPEKRRLLPLLGIEHVFCGSWKFLCILFILFFLFFCFLFCTMTKKCTIISQIITLLYVSTLSCHHQGACINYMPSYASISIAVFGNTIYN